MSVHRSGIGVLVESQGIRHIPSTLCCAIPHNAIAFLSQRFNINAVENKTKQNKKPKSLCLLLFGILKIEIH